MAQCPIADANVVDEAVKGAEATRGKWTEMTALERGQVLRKTAQIIRVGEKLQKRH